jgi:hypothetical protein
VTPARLRVRLIVLAAAAACPKNVRTRAIEIGVAVISGEIFSL